jgi:arginine decarboxylase
MDLSNFFSAAEARMDRWSQLNTTARSWESAVKGGRPTEKFKAEAATICDELGPLEALWAYPGPKLMGTLKERLVYSDAVGFARLTQKIQSALLSESYRRDPGAWEPEEEGELPLAEKMEAYAAGQETYRPYFEVLMVTSAPPANWERSRQELRRVRRSGDQFIYEIVPVGSFEDAVLAVIFNADIQAVVMNDGFGFQSHHALPLFREHLKRHMDMDPDSVSPQQLAMTLAKAVKTIRPEIDIYLLADRDVAGLAGSDQAVAIRRIFYDIEEIMEIHLSILDGVNDRYETPYFSNLKKYSQKPIGTFHALPVARGKSIFKSNWIRDMGHFYGVNLFLAESSATTGGLDSLLEPTGNI